MRAASILVALVGLVVASCVLPAPLAAGLPLPQAQQQQDADLIDRPISAVRFEGLVHVPDQFVRNNVRTAVGDPYLPDVVGDDVRRLTRLGRFRTVMARLELQSDGSVVIIFELEEQAILSVVQVVGNRLVPDQDILTLVRLAPGDPVDDFRIQNSLRAIEDLYRERGHYLTAVTINATELEESGVLIFTVIEGPRVRIKEVAFQGNERVADAQLSPQIKTRAYVPLVRKGVLDRQMLADDVASIDRYYRDRGYLDVRVDYLPELSPDNKEAKVTFLISEGRQYMLRSLKVRNDATGGDVLRVFTIEQIAALLDIKTGDVFSYDRLTRSLRILQDAYHEMGYLDVELRDSVSRTPGEEPLVDLTLIISEGRRYKVGLITLAGNRLTRDKVIRREIRLQPGRWFDGTEIAGMTNRLQRTRLFGTVNTTLVEPDPNDPHRDMLVEVTETDTGSVNFGVAIGSDSGAFGEVSINQRNFDILDTPETLEEYIRGKAFRGGGQRFSMVLRPGDEIFLYSVSLTEPHFMESDYALSVGGSVYQRRFRLFDEKRLTFSTGVSRRLGDVWNMGISVKAENVELDDIEPDAPLSVFADTGPDALTQLSLTLTRTTIASLTRPGRGNRLELRYDFAGALGGDITFHRFSADYTHILTLDEDFLGRLTTLKLVGRAGYIIADGRVPTYERFYLGGRTFRGFDFREVSPKGIAADTLLPSPEPIGGLWMFYAGAQYEFPMFEETMTGVFFIDSGTVTPDIGLSSYRASIGTGVRLYIPQLGPVPLAFDFAFPFLKEDTDDTQVFSFSVELPF